MTNSSDDTPAAARERVRRELRRARQQTNPSLTQGDVAKRLGWSISKVQRIEIGEVAVSETDLRAMLDLLGVTAAETVARLVDDARLARRERWSTKPAYRKYLSPGLRQLLQFEKVATEIRSYQPFILPGVVQTPAVAEYIVDAARDDLEPEERQVRVEARGLRRAQVVDRADGPAYYLVLDESVLMRRIGGTRLMAEQLMDLVAVAEHPNILIRVMPLRESRGAIMGTAGAFTLINLSDDADDDVVYWESFREDSLLRDPGKIRPYRTAFEQLWKLSLPEDASLRLINANATALRSELDRPQAILN